MGYTFHSVILASAYGIKNIKLKMINEGAYIPSPGENKLYNSPWNIAASFEVDMSFSLQEISSRSMAFAQFSTLLLKHVANNSLLSR
ncbi:MAG: hypothetical protein FWG10_12280 [Eubacteriaceae bacterium]|nr:hypothetical protein [Eubacteriaceae bacterium]